MNIEIDGPPTSYFCIRGVQYTYKSYGIGTLGSDDPGKLLPYLHDHIADMKNQGIIVWRRRPEFQWCPAVDLSAEFPNIPPEPARWKLTYRCVVVPDWPVGVPMMPEKPEGLDTNLI